MLLRNLGVILLTSSFVCAVANSEEGNSPATIQFASSAQLVQEDQSRFTVRAVLDTPVDHAYEFDWSIAGVASLGVDFDCPEGPFTVSEGETEKEIHCELIDDNYAEDNEVIVITIVEADGEIGSDDVHTVTIEKNRQ